MRMAANRAGRAQKTGQAVGRTSAEGCEVQMPTLPRTTTGVLSAILSLFFSRAILRAVRRLTGICYTAARSAAISGARSHHAAT